jgi:hypothetical protein
MNKTLVPLYFTASDALAMTSGVVA